VIRIAVGFVLSFVIGAGCRYFDIPAASPPVIPGALIVLAMTLGYSSMARVMTRRNQAAVTKSQCGGSTGLPVSMERRHSAGSCFSRPMLSQACGAGGGGLKSTPQEPIHAIQGCHYRGIGGYGLAGSAKSPRSRDEEFRSIAHI